MMVVGTTSHPRLDTDGLVGGHGAIRLNSVLQTVQFPACVANLATSLADVDRDSLTHVGLRVVGGGGRVLYK